MGEEVILPATVTANMSDATTKEVSVTWNPTMIDTSSAETKTATGTVDGFDGKVTFTAIVKEKPVVIESLETPTTVEVFVGETVALPATVTATMSDATTKEISVTWEPTTIDTSTAGDKTATGRVEGFDGEVTFTVTVKEKPVVIESLETPTTVEVFVGETVTLPETVTATMSDATTKEVSVTWNPATIDTTTAGTKTATGTVDGFEGSVTFTAIVKEKPVVIESLETPTTVEVFVGETVTLPETVTATMNDETTKEVAVTWNPTTIDTSTAGTKTATGTVDGFDGEVTFTVTVKLNPFTQSAEIANGNKVVLNFTNNVLIGNTELAGINVSSSEEKKTFFKDVFGVEENEIYKKLNFENMEIELTGTSISITANNNLLDAANFQLLDADRYGELLIELELNKDNITDEYKQKLTDNQDLFLKLTSFAKRGVYGELVDYKEGEKKAIFLNKEQGIEERDKEREVTLEVNAGATSTEATVKMSTNYAIGTDISTWSNNKNTDWFTKDGAILFARLYKVDNGTETPVFFNTVFKTVKIHPGPFGGLTYLEGTGRLHGDFGTGTNGTKLFAGETRIADSKYKGALSYNSKLNGSNIYSIWLPKGSITVNITNVLKDTPTQGNYEIYLEAYAPAYKDVINNTKWGAQEDMPLLNKVKVVEFTID